MSSSWLDRLLNQKPSSADQAKDRLKLVLIHDRTDLTPSVIDALKVELLEVISRHIEIDPDSIRITMAQEGREQRLMADIPLKPAQRRRKG